MKRKFRVLSILLLLVMVFAFSTPANAAKLSQKKITISKGEVYTLYMKGATKTVKWKSSNKSVASVSKTGVVKGKRTGTCRITATVGKKKYTCTVYVRTFNRKKYLRTVEIDEFNITDFLDVRITPDNHTYLVWINKSYYCYDMEDSFLIGYSGTYNYIYYGFSGEWPSTGYFGGSYIDRYEGDVTFRTEHIGNIDHEDWYNLEYEFDHVYGEMKLIKSSAVKKVTPSGKLILLDGKTLGSEFSLS